MTLNRSALPVIAAAAALLALGACKAEKAPEAVASGEPTPPSSEWVAENPTDPAVPVTLPETPVTGTPSAAASEPAAK